MESIKQIAKWMVANKFADYCSAEQEGIEQDKIFVYWRTPQDVAVAIFKWAKEGSRIGSVETVIDIIEEGTI